MLILCKGFNLYNQLNGPDNCIGEFRPSFELDRIEQFELGHTFSVISCSNNELKINCNLANNVIINIKNIRQIAVTDKVILILDDAGRLFKAAIIDDWKITAVSNFIKDNDRLKIISSNSKLNVAYSENGNLYSIPEKLAFCSKDIVAIKTGREHCVLLDQAGNVYTFGAGSRGQLGNGQLDDQQSPVQVEALAGIKISSIAAGGWHSTAVSQDGDLYTWGWNGNGQLGLEGSTAGNGEERVSVMATPHVVDIGGCEENHVIQVACGNKHTIVLLDNNTLYGCGWNKYKQLKCDDQEDYHSFTFIQDFSKETIDKILCGPWNSAVICK